MRPKKINASDFAHSPFVFLYEVTQACDLVCKHCRACAVPQRDPDELDTADAKRLIDQIATFPKPPLLVFTGGDPLKRADIFELVEHARDIGVVSAMTPSATPLVTKDAIERLGDAGLSRLAISIDSPDAGVHDAFRGFAGSYDRSMQIMADARAVGMPLQVNTTITARNIHQVDTMAELLAGEGIALWSVFFLIPVGRGIDEDRITADQYEEVFEKLWGHAQRQPYAIKTTEAHHYRRFVMEKGGNPQRGPIESRPVRAPVGVNDGNGVMFTSHTGRIYPSGFLPVECGRFPLDSVVDVYRNAALMKALRDPKQLGGKCGECEYRKVCGGSRARAFAVYGDPLAEEPDCAYTPRVAMANA